MTTLLLNGHRLESAAEPDTPLLYVLRNDLGLKGSRFGCGDGMCGACTVLLDGRPTTSCNLPISAVADRSITTIEGLGDEEHPHPMQRAILDLQAAQCGYCLTGVVMTGAALLAERGALSRSEIRAALDGVLCRCGAYDRMVRAVERAADLARAGA